MKTKKVEVREMKKIKVADTAEITRITKEWLQANVMVQKQKKIIM